MPQRSWIGSLPVRDETARSRAVDLRFLPALLVVHSRHWSASDGPATAHGAPRYRSPRLLQLAANGILLRSLPNPLTPEEVARIRDARPAGPSPTPAAEPPRVERRVSSRGALVIAGQRIQAGTAHAGRTLSVEAADHTIRFYDDDQSVLVEVPRTTTKSIARFKVRKPQRPRRVVWHAMVGEKASVFAAWYDRQGPAGEVFQVGELPAAEPGPDEVRVRLTHSGVNPGDTKKRRGWLGSAMPFPRVIPHSDGAGVIETVGEGVDPAGSGSGYGYSALSPTARSGPPRS
jgi:hypothetical protein